MKNPFKKKDQPKEEPKQEPPTKVMESDFVLEGEKTQTKQEAKDALEQPQAETQEPEIKLGLHLGAFEQQLYGLLNYQMQQNQVMLEELAEIKQLLKK